MAPTQEILWEDRNNHALSTECRARGILLPRDGSLLKYQLIQLIVDDEYQKKKGMVDFGSFTQRNDPSGDRAREWITRQMALSVRGAEARFKSVIEYHQGLEEKHRIQRVEAESALAAGLENMSLAERGWIATIEKRMKTAELFGDDEDGEQLEVDSAEKSVDKFDHDHKPAAHNNSGELASQDPQVAIPQASNEHEAGVDDDKKDGSDCSDSGDEGDSEEGTSEEGTSEEGKSKESEFEGSKSEENNTKGEGDSCETSDALTVEYPQADEKHPFLHQAEIEPCYGILRKVGAMFLKLRFHKEMAIAFSVSDLQKYVEQFKNQDQTVFFFKAMMFDKLGVYVLFENSILGFDNMRECLRFVSAQVKAGFPREYCWDIESVRMYVGRFVENSEDEGGDFAEAFAGKIFYHVDSYGATTTSESLAADEESNEEEAPVADDSSEESEEE